MCSRRFLVVAFLGVLGAGCSSPAPERRVPAGALPVPPGVGFLARPGRVLLAREVILEIPLQLEAKLFLAGDRVGRRTAPGWKLRQAVGRARLRYDAGLEIREAERILVRVGAATVPVRLEARGHVVLLDLPGHRAVRGATALEVKGGRLRWYGDYREEPWP